LPLVNSQPRSPISAPDHSLNENCDMRIILQSDKISRRPTAGLWQEAFPFKPLSKKGA
jgi:hypothetical protein